ncbi:hypothetical protein KUTeg_006424 [Tegillarca granosa]|uniref:Dixin n=1 Tax=Tegillarca granosa TaxID=220873 RepID=A0ABQ9FL54_TEGGR|nr:hypothetical protein KUTeg_006424 [Tegillarca granosa]
MEEGYDDTMADSPFKSPVEESVSLELRQQLNAYVAWVNSQLKKKPGVRLVEDIRNDMKDGVALIELIEIVAGQKIAGVHMVPSGITEMKENIDAILRFMSTNRIRMHHTSSRDIVEGNLKSIMRLILALAAHFKPQSVKHSANDTRSGSGEKTRNHSVSGIAQGAAAALADARRKAARAGSIKGRNRSHYNYSDRSSSDRSSDKRRTFQEGSSSDQYSDSDHSFSNDRSRLVHSSRVDGDGASADKSPLSSARYNPQQSSINVTPSPKKEKLQKSQSSDQIYAKDSGTELEDSGNGPVDYTNVVDRAQYEDLLQEYNYVSDAMTVTRSELMKLQDLLLSGEPPDGSESKVDITEGFPPTDQLVILRSQLQQSAELNSDLKDDLSKTKNECMQLQGTKVEVHKKFQEKEKTIIDLRKDIARRDQRIDHLQNELQEKEALTRALKLQITELHDRLRVVGETGAHLSARVASQDKRMAKLEDELQVVKGALHSLRLSFKQADPQQHTIDTLEQSVSMLLEKLQQHYTSSGTPQHQYDNGVSRRLNFDSTGDVRRSPLSLSNNNTGYPYNHLDSPSPSSVPSPTPTQQQQSTKVLYFTDKTVNPYVCTIPKRLGEITLKDFKELHDKKGNYRYSFKALDPEFGTVKEEIMVDTDIIPGWEGKIVAWIEEDTG